MKTRQDVTANYYDKKVLDDPLEDPLVPNIFQNFFTEKETKYKLKSSGNYYVSFKKSKLSQFSISFRGPHLWNTVLKNETELKNTSSLSIFKRKLKSLIMSTENITNYF